MNKYIYGLNNTYKYVDRDGNEPIFNGSLYNNDFFANLDRILLEKYKKERSYNLIVDKLSKEFYEDNRGIPYTEEAYNYKLKIYIDKGVLDHYNQLNALENISIEILINAKI